MSTLVPTMADVAREAGVSVVTVDRVLNRRGIVRAATEEKVLEAAQRLGFAPGKVHAVRGTQPPSKATTASLRVAFFLLRQDSTFYRQLAQALSDEAQRTPQVCEHDLYYFDERDPAQCADFLLEHGRHYDAIAIVSVDHPLISQAVDKLADKGVRTYALVTDLSAARCAGHVGLDNRKAGRTAAWAIARLSRSAGKVGLLLGDHRFLCQELCEISFRSYFREQASDFQVLDTRLTHETAEQARQMTRELLKHPDLVGLYVSCGGRLGAMEALREAGRQHDIVVVCHELLESTREGLVDGTLDMVMSLPRTATARALLELMSQPALQAATAAVGGLATNRLLPFDLVTAENV